MSSTWDPRTPVELAVVSDRQIRASTEFSRPSSDHQRAVDANQTAAPRILVDTQRKLEHP
jgi:hypothetical protein